MTRRRTTRRLKLAGDLARIAALVLGLANAHSNALAQDFDQVEIHSVPLRGGLYMLIGRGGNIVIPTGEEGVLVVDDQYAPLTPKIRSAIEALNAGPIRWVVNTHWHGDHTGGNEALHEAGAVIVAHDQVRERMSREQFIASLDRRVPPSPIGALPTLTFSESMSFYFNGDEVRVAHVPPAHTDGDAMVHFRAVDVLHTGDIFFNGMYPYFDASSGGRFIGLVAAAEGALAMADADTMVVPGHGPLGHREDLVTYVIMLTDVRDRVQAAIGAGKTREQVVALRPTADYDAHWGHGFMKPDRFVALVYDSLSVSASEAD